MIEPNPGCGAPAYAVESGWLVEVVNEHTCGTARDGHFGAHEPGCGLVPVATVEDLLVAQVALHLLRKVVDYWDGRPVSLHGHHIYSDLLDVLKAITPVDQTCVTPPGSGHPG